MSGFDLVPVEGGDPVRLPPGETVLGRGPFLGVSDKRVSRQHALLENLDGQLRLKPTHVNPCFVQSTPAGEPRPLQRGSWHPLRHGDLFSLLPGQLLYEVVAADGESDGGGGTPRNSQMFEEEELPGPPEPRVEPPPAPIGREPAAAVSQQDEKDRARPVEAEPDRSDAAPPSTPRRRVLPTWMMAAVTAPNASPSCSRRVQSAAKGGKRAPAKKAETSEEEEEEEEEDMPKKRSRKTDVPRERPAVRLQSGSVRPEVSDESDGFVAEEGGGTAPADANATTRGEAGKSTDGRQTAGRAESVGSNSSRASGPAPSTRGRTPCPYGRDCYRKNPVHFQECSHPGVTDYEDEEDEEEADRPECPYGTDCYSLYEPGFHTSNLFMNVLQRMISAAPSAPENPLHRREYKHTKKPAYNTRTAPTKTPGADEDLSDDDSFIDDDDSEEAGDDSDYVPPDSDSGKEDVSELQKEARAFLKKRK